MEKTPGITDSLTRLLELTSEGADERRSSASRVELSKSVEDCLYELTGQLLDLFRLEDEHHHSEGPEFERLVAARSKLSQEVHQLFEAVIESRTHETRNFEELLNDVQLISLRFQKYRALGIELASGSAD